MAPADEETVKLDVSEATEVLNRLQQKRAALEKELAKIPSAPTSSKDVFHLCRGFERAFVHTVETTDYAGYIRRAFMDEGLMGTVAKLPLERNFKLEHVKEVVREADGYQAHLVSPEFGLRRLVDETIGMVLEPVNMCVRRVHQVLIDAAREASRKASLMANSTVIDEGREPLRLPAFEKAVMFAVTQALEQWRDEAMEVARTIVNMEQSYVTAAFFRHRTAERYKAMMQAQETARLLGEGKAVAADSDSEDDDDSTGDGDSPRRPRELTASSTPIGGPLSGGLTIPATMNDPGDLLTGYLEKRIGENSGRQSLPEAWKWQKRYFVLTEPKGMLYYFKSADDPPNYKGLINMRECKAEDVDVDGLPKSASRSKYDLDGGGGQVSLLIRVSHKDPSKPCVKNHHSLVLRAESASEKFMWLARLKNASDGGGTTGRAPLRAYTSEQLRTDSVTSSVAPTPRSDGGRRGGTPKTGDVPLGGIGSSLNFTEDSTLGPEPLIWNSPNRYGNGVDNKVFDDYLQQLGEDTAAYVRTVCQTIVLTVPKAIIHCQVKRAQAHLLEHLYGSMTSLGGAEAEYLLEEDPESIMGREKLKKSVGDVADAIGLLKHLQEVHFEDDEKASQPLEVPADIITLAEYRRRRTSDRSTSAVSNGNSPENGVRRLAYPDAASSGTGRPSVATAGGPSNPPARTLSSSRRQATPPPPRVSIPSGPPGPSSSPSPMPRRRPPPAPPGGETPR
ncbi:Dynamin-2B [Coccomyxa sp. Obi]|nr:Dynamin-2B [Coccomyxa sp. Obi]